MSQRDKKELMCEEYFRLQREYQSKLGKKTVVFMEVGGFFEAYCWDPQLDPTIKDPEKYQVLGKAYKVSKICGPAITHKSKKPHSIRNPLMCGFPPSAYERHRNTLIGKGYKVVRVVQQKNDGKITRFVEDVGSAGTLLANINTLPVTNNMVAIYIEVMKPSKKNLDYQLCCGFSSIDVSTGQNTVSESYSKPEDPAAALQGVYRFLLATCPRELSIYLQLPKEVEPEKYKLFLEEHLELERYPNRYLKVNEVPKEFNLVEYQTQFLSKLFKINLDTTVRVIDHRIIEELDLGLYTYGRISYLLLLDGCRFHNEKLLSSLKRPETRWVDEEDHLILAHNALLQLNVVPSDLTRTKKSSMNSLFSVVNLTLTPVGKRLLHTSLVNPLTDVEELEWRYAVAAEFVNNPELLDSVVKSLRGIPDLERYHHKLNLRMIQPGELAALFKAYQKIADLYEILYTFIGEKKGNPLSKLLLRSSQIQEFNEVLEYTYNRVDLDVLPKSILRDDVRRIEIVEKSFLYEGIEPDHDKLLGNITDSESQLGKIAQHLNGFLTKTRGKLLSYQPRKAGKIEEGKEEKEEDPEGPPEGEEGSSAPLGFATTESKASKLKASKNEIDTTLCGKIVFEKDRKTVIVTSEVIKKLIYLREDSQVELEKYLYSFYNRLVTYLIGKNSYFAALNRSLAQIDFLQSSAQCCRKYKYYRPTIEKSESSFLKATEMRHPLAERVTQAEYIPNSISLGKKDEKDPDSYGMVLFGINSCGKSAMLKAVGSNILLAQAGYFTACKLVYSPYKTIVTRLSGHDDILKGQSSFVVEMLELKLILKEAGANSLILVDELTRGTETISGISLSIATLLTLLERKASHLFTSHLHDLPKYRQIKELPDSQLRICHLAAEYDIALDELVYIRTLQPGSGSTRYGLEVAKSLHLDTGFLEVAGNIRSEIDPELGGRHLLDLKTSRYSPKVYVDSCLLCGKKNSLQTHHIKEQHTADKDGFINSFHKNESFNLAILCETCHTKLHTDGKKIDVKQLLNGVKITVVNE